MDEMKERKEILDSIDALLDRAYKLLGEERTQTQEVAKKKPENKSSEKLKFACISLGVTKDEFIKRAQAKGFIVNEKRNSLQGEISFGVKKNSTEPEKCEVYIDPIVSPVTEKVYAMEVCRCSYSNTKQILHEFEYLDNLLQKKYARHLDVDFVDKVLASFIKEHIGRSFAWTQYRSSIGWIVLSREKDDPEYGYYELNGELYERFRLLFIDKDEWQIIQNNKQKRQKEDLENLL